MTMNKEANSGIGFFGPTSPIVLICTVDVLTLEKHQ